MLNEIKDVDSSVWISASAGTGKTKSLIDRVIALLLNRVDPAKILCLTYTKAAATEMLNRLSAKAQSFLLMSDTELTDALSELEFDKSYLKTAKTLYEKSLISSEWVQIQTIHSFCFGILKKFPIETGLLPGITLCDDYQKKKLLNQAIEKVIFREDCRRFCEYIANFTTDLSEFFDKNILKIQKFLSKFDDFESLYCDFFQINDKTNLFSKNLDITLIDQLFNGQHTQIFQDLADVLFLGSAEDIKKANILLENAKNPSGDFINAFMTGDKIRSRLCTSTLSNKYPNLQEKMVSVAQKAVEFCNMRNNYVSASANIALFSVIRKIVDEFNELKRFNHCIDFDDVISMTSGLLNNIEWVMYKIDNSIDHLLLDEAQDTSPEQWEVISTITDEFFANYGSSKTVFIVGDEKQSIYSFQGADVQIFKKMHDNFEKRSIASGQKFHNIDLNKSYRSTGNILSFVDDIFKTTKHYTNRAENSGVIDIVDLFEGEKENDDDNNDNVTENDDTSNTNGVSISEPPITAEKNLAEYVADFIKSAINSHIYVESKNRSALASDFMVLFQRRDVKAMWEIIKSLRKRNIAVSGIDRVLLKDQIIVEDLITFAQFAVFPLDNLLCARVLKSPIVGISEDELMHLCLERESKSLWEFALASVELSEKYDLKILDDFIGQAVFSSAYDFFATILANGIKEKFIARLGTKCLETLYDFFDIIMSYEKENTPSLQSFLQWFTKFGGDIEIKHDSFTDENCVRLMTVHASKGLQAPFVILADTHFYKIKNDKILQTDDGILLWNMSANMRTSAMEDIYNNYSKYELDESRRRLYVALTRAEDYVCVLGQARKNRQSNCWYDLIKREMNTNKFEEINVGDQKILRFGEFSVANNSDNKQKSEKPKKTENILPEWFYKKLELPSYVTEEELFQNESTIYGNCVHFLLSELPKYDASLYDTIADTLIDRFDISDLLKTNAKKEAIRILNNKNFAFIFDNKSLSEVSFIDNENKENRVDKIAFLDNDIWIIDFKTGSYQENIPHVYVEQLKRYKQSVSKVFDMNTKIRTAILWTSAEKLVELH